MDELIAKLHRKRAVLHDTITLYRTLELVNPDGPEAADALTTLQARLREALDMVLEAAESGGYSVSEFKQLEALATSDLAEAGKTK
jgi:hypothetical protein